MAVAAVGGGGVEGRGWFFGDGVAAREEVVGEAVWVLGAVGCGLKKPLRLCWPLAGGAEDVGGALNLLRLENFAIEVAGASFLF